MAGRRVQVPPDRVPRWFDNFAARHGAVSLSVEAGRLVATAEDGEVAWAGLPFGAAYDGEPEPSELAAAARRAVDGVAWGLLLVRKGGFAVARLEGERFVESKVGQRHVQGRTKAGGQSQQRFARRRDNQARQAYEAAAEHAVRILTAAPLDALVCGGDRAAVDAVLADPRLARVGEWRTDLWLAVPDPRRAVLEQAAVDATSVGVELRGG